MMKKRIFMSALGVLTGAVAVGFFKLAAFGVDPFQSFMSGMDQLIPIDFGTLYMIVNGQCDPLHHRKCTLDQKC